MKKIGRYIFILALVALLWDTIMMQPIKVLSLYIHQIGHFLMAFAFSYGLEDFHISFYESTFAINNVHSGISAFMITNAGYIGSLLFALLIFHFKNTYVKSYLLGSIAIVFVIFTISYTGFSYQLIHCALFSSFVIALNMINNDSLNGWAIDVIGISGVVFAIYDTAVNTIFYNINKYFELFPNLLTYKPFSDTVYLEKLTGIPALVWGIIWLILSLVLAYLILLWSSKKTEKTASS